MPRWDGMARIGYIGQGNNLRRLIAHTPEIANAYSTIVPIAGSLSSMRSRTAWPFGFLRIQYSTAANVMNVIGVTYQNVLKKSATQLRIFVGVTPMAILGLERCRLMGGL